MVSHESHGILGLDEAATPRRRWFSALNVLILALGVWNGYFLAAFLYAVSAQTHPRGPATPTMTIVWLCGDVVIVLAAWAAWAVLRARRRAT
jgi:hypothetical protein